MKRVAIQGTVGSFHDIAAHQYFAGEQVQLICCNTFEEVFANIKKDPTVIGMMAIENTIAGSLLHNYDLLRASGTTVVGEHKLHIQHSICCLPDDDWTTLREVHSHPVALMQCRGFLASHPGMKAVEAEDTAGAAEWIARNGSHGWAAICHSSKTISKITSTSSRAFSSSVIRARPITCARSTSQTRPVSSSPCPTRKAACPKC